MPGCSIRAHLDSIVGLEISVYADGTIESFLTDTGIPWSAEISFGHLHSLAYLR